MDVKMSKILGRWGIMLGLLSLAVPAHSQSDSAPVNAGKQGQNNFDYTAPNGGVPKDLASRVGIEQNPGTQVPLQLTFKDETGKTVQLGDYFGKKPVMLMMLQLTCDQICSAQFESFTASLNDEKFGFTPGKEFEVVTVSIDPRESYLVAQDVKDERAKNLQHAASISGWHFLTATDPGNDKNIKTLAKALGIKYIWDEGSKQYIHPDGVIITTPEGKISRYFMELQYGPRDLRYTLIEASKEHIGTVVDRFALSCFHYNPATGKYTFRIMAFLRWFGAAFVLGGLLSIALMVRLEKRKQKQDAGTPSVPGAGPHLRKA